MDYDKHSEYCSRALGDGPLLTTLGRRWMRAGSITLIPSAPISFSLTNVQLFVRMVKDPSSPLRGSEQNLRSTYDKGNTISKNQVRLDVIAYLSWRVSLKHNSLKNAPFLYHVYMYKHHVKTCLVTSTQRSCSLFWDKVDICRCSWSDRFPITGGGRGSIPITQYDQKIAGCPKACRGPHGTTILNCSSFSFSPSANRFLFQHGG